MRLIDKDKLMNYFSQEYHGFYSEIQLAPYQVNNIIDNQTIIEQFDLENFKKELYEWHNSIEEELKKNKYDMTLLCVDAVLSSVEDMINDNTMFID